MAHRVIGDYAYVTVGDADGNGVVQLAERGQMVPPGVADGVLEHLVSVGLIEQVDDQDETEPSGDDDQGEAEAAKQAAEDLSQLDLNELRALAADRKVDLAGATKKADIIAAIVAAA